MAETARKAFRKNVEWEYDRLILPREFSRNVVTRMLVERAEKGGWELRSVRIGPDGVRRVLLRRKIIRQPRPEFFYV
ncbi:MULTISPECIES: DUF5703 family protein [unclassified Nocardioides]|uniref:DUF5703 family protein n=1 Tax=unclassified Nocardioides TaxID=2615069 RepID=UPI0006FC3D9E|nr:MULTISPECIES: DUF5703 family protein [unclassified Nocardioides]KQY64461.1 hypothetical protein ASD30_05910 [Nocardioides sp. Root140]KQZ70386.1 hypothetical protein ASD66_12235 [Nocardioides sp. Root151]KRF18246.1 hypothetical protein ASH02_01375 [Nocardioides sp. Soil796]